MKRPNRGPRSRESTEVRPESRTAHLAHSDVGRLRLAILQRVIPGYRVSLFERLVSHPEIETKLFIGADLPGSKVRSAEDLSRIEPRRLRTHFVRAAGRTFPWHRGLVSALSDFRPHVILCEGESHFLGYLQAMWYRRRHDPDVGLIHWCFIGLPGESDFQRPVAACVRAWFRRRFDAFLVYSTYSKERLTALGVSPDRAFVATNVGDVDRFMTDADELTLNRMEARARLKLPERPTVLYAGTLDPRKRPEVMIALARVFPDVNFVLVGSGPRLQTLRKEAQDSSLFNVFLPGRVSKELAIYFRAADLMLVPGRGGIVISEAMASGLPVVVHQADGTEYDLVSDDLTGIRVAEGGLDSFRDVVEDLISDLPRLARMGRHAQELVRSKMNQDAMVAAVIRAAEYATGHRGPKSGDPLEPATGLLAERGQADHRAGR